MDPSDSKKPTSNSSPRPWFRIALGLVPIAILMLLEGTARRLLRNDNSPVAEAAVSAALFVPERGAVMKPNVRLDLHQYIPAAEGMIVTNSLGFRMREFDVKKKPGVLRIVCLGDSVTFGWGVPEQESYPRQLERLLRDRWKRPVEVLNLGIPGARSQRGVILCRTVVPRLSPDLVIVGYGFNDSAYSRKAKTSSPRLLKLRLILGRSSIYTAIEKIAHLVPRQRDLPPPKPLGSHSQYRYNNYLMVTSLKKLGAEIILADLDLPNYFASDTLDLVGGNQDLPVLHARQLLEGTAPQDAPSPSTTPAGPGLLARLRFAGSGAPSLVGKGPELGEMVPGTVLLKDDGEAGDATPRDGIFSVFIRTDMSKTLDFTFVKPARLGSWGGRNVPGAAAPMSFHVYYRHKSGVPTLMTPVREIDHWPYQRYCIRWDPVHLNQPGLAILARNFVPIIERLRPDTPGSTESSNAK